MPITLEAPSEAPSALGWVCLHSVSTAGWTRGDTQTRLDPESPPGYLELGLEIAAFYVTGPLRSPTVHSSHARMVTPFLTVLPCSWGHSPLEVLGMPCSVGKADHPQGAEQAGLQMPEEACFIRGVRVTHCCRQWVPFYR